MKSKQAYGLRGKQAPSARTRETYNRLRRDAKANKKRENWSKQKGRCPECGKEILNVSMKRHRRTMHQVTGEEYLCRPVGTTGTFEITAPRRGKPKQCPVQGCEGGGMDRFSIFQHFAWVHGGATLTVRGEETLPKCRLCGMQVRNVERHQKTKTCERLQRRRVNEGLQDKQYESEKVSITVNGRRIERVRSFTYLGRVLSQNDDDTNAITTQLERAPKKWGSIVRILKNERAEPEIMA